MHISSKIAKSFTDNRSKATPLHNFVRDEIKFGFSNFFWDQSASEVLREGKGFCNTKSSLFVALLRAANIPARQVFVNINSKILDSFVNTGTEFVDHSYAEVFLDGKWIKTDS